MKEFTCPERDSEARIRALVQYVKSTKTEACVQMQGGLYVEVHPRELKHARKLADELVWTYETVIIQLDLWGGEIRFRNLVPNLGVQAKEALGQFKKLEPSEITGTLRYLIQLALVTQCPFVWKGWRARHIAALLKDRTHARQVKIKLTSDHKQRALFQQGDALIQEAIEILSKSPNCLDVPWKRAARNWINRF